MGATPIGSAGHAPDKKEVLRKKKLDKKKGRNTKKKKKKLEPMIGYKYPSIAPGATYIRSTGYAPNDK
jgi:hypothetical protein